MANDSLTPEPQSDEQEYIEGWDENLDCMVRVPVSQPIAETPKLRGVVGR